MLIEEYKPEIAALKQKLEEMRDLFDVVVKEDRIAELEHKMGAPGFWDEPERRRKLLRL